MAVKRPPEPGALLGGKLTLTSRFSACDSLFLACGLAGVVLSWFFSRNGQYEQTQRLYYGQGKGTPA